MKHASTLGCVATNLRALCAGLPTMRGQSSPSIWPSWTLQRTQRFPSDLYQDLVPLAMSLDDANKLIFSTIQQHNLIPGFEHNKTLRYYVNSFNTSDTATEDIDHDTLKSMLLEDDYVKIWKESLKELLRFQGSDQATLGWRLAKQRALDVLEQRDLIGGLYVGTEQRLLDGGWHDVCKAVKWKIHALERFTAVYDAQSSPNAHQPNPPKERTYHLRSIEEMRANATNKRVAVAYSELQHEHFTSTLTALVSLGILIALIPFGFAYPLSSSEHGSTSDVDFYLLIQNSVMAALGIAIAICPTFRWSMSHAKWWSQVFAIVGVFCAIATVPMYLKLPVMWSAFVSFVAMAVQVFMALQLAVVADSSISLSKRQ